MFIHVVRWTIPKKTIIIFLPFLSGRHKHLMLPVTSPLSVHSASLSKFVLNISCAGFLSWLGTNGSPSITKQPEGHISSCGYSCVSWTEARIFGGGSVAFPFFQNVEHIGYASLQLEIVMKEKNMLVYTCFGFCWKGICIKKTIKQKMNL